MTHIEPAVAAPIAAARGVAARGIAELILAGFDKHYRLFRELSAGARERFERADWAAVRGATGTRIDMYDQRVFETVEAVTAAFPAAREEDALWPHVKRAFIGLLYDHKQPECAETYYNSVACRVLDRTYYRNDYIFWRPSVSTEFMDGDAPTYRCWYPAAAGLRRTLLDIVESFDLKVPFADLRRDLKHVIRAARAHFPRRLELHPNFQLQVMTSLFFRNKGAYIVGRVINGNADWPFVVPVRHSLGAERLGAERQGGGPADGPLYLDALLLSREQMGTLFSLARAYFMVDMEVPAAAVTFLRQLMPTKPRAELYIALGLQKQGKTLFYRDLQEHLSHSNDHFVVAPGTRGLVMMVFTLPSFPYVFKIIRDTFGPPKRTTRREVMDKYLLVKYHDRVGRMADTLEYSDVALPIARIAPALLQELEASCADSLTRYGEQVVIKHLYIERRMVPLDLFLRDAPPAKALGVIKELGRAIRELAEADIFPGDLLLKNFGVTRWGRVVFYDYDEICYLHEVRFRRIPPPRDYDDELSAEAWFSVGPDDVFPEELPAFIFPDETHRALFMQLHGELADAAWWIAKQEEISAGRQADVFPYPEETRFGLRFAR